LNKSYSKIRHIQESNLKLEQRLLNEQTQPMSGGTNQNQTQPMSGGTTQIRVWSKSKKQPVGFLIQGKGFVPDQNFSSQFRADNKGIKSNPDLYLQASKKGIPKWAY
jgi:hypothetical protein